MPKSATTARDRRDRALLDSYNNSLVCRVYLNPHWFPNLEIAVKSSLIERLHPIFSRIREPEPHDILDTLREFGDVARRHVKRLKSQLARVRPSMDYAASEELLQAPITATLNLYLLPDQRRIILTDDLVIPWH